VGRKITFEELFDSADPALEPAREVIRYRLLLACGMGIAALGGLDGIVFCGRYARLGGQLGPWLASKIQLRPPAPSPVPWEVFGAPLRRLVAEEAEIVLMERVNAVAEDAGSYRAVVDR